MRSSGGGSPTSPADEQNDRYEHGPERRYYDSAQYHAAAEGIGGEIPGLCGSEGQRTVRVSGAGDREGTVAARCQVGDTHPQRVGVEGELGELMKNVAEIGLAINSATAAVG